MFNCPPRLANDITVLSQVYPLSYSDDFKWLTVRDFRLPPGFNYITTEILMEIPRDYPRTPIGVSNYVYLRPDLRFYGRRLKDLHDSVTPGWGYWAWFCYQWIKWDPIRDDLVTLLEMIRTDLTNPKTV